MLVGRITLPSGSAAPVGRPINPVASSVLSASVHEWIRAVWYRQRVTDDGLEACW